jgi:hypothetical protein
MTRQLPEGMMTEFIPSEEQLEVIKNMASHGMRQLDIAAAIGISDRTLRDNKECSKVYHESFADGISKVAASVYRRALEQDDPILQMFVLKTKAQWREHSYARLDRFKGTTQEKKEAVEEAFRNGDLSIESYQKLTAALTEWFKVEELDARLVKLEKAQNGKL